MFRSFGRADFCHSKAKICTEYEAISKIFNDAVTEICLSKPYEVRLISLYAFYLIDCEEMSVHSFMSNATILSLDTV